jgi:hypothetical protein
MSRHNDEEDLLELGPKTKFTTTVRTAISALLFVGALISGYFIFQGKLDANSEQITQLRAVSEKTVAQVAEHDRAITTITTQLEDDKELLVQILDYERKRDRDSQHYVGPRGTP